MTDRTNANDLQILSTTDKHLILWNVGKVLPLNTHNTFDRNLQSEGKKRFCIQK